MKVSKAWLSELVNLKTSVDEVVSLLPLRTIGTKEVNDQFIELDMKGYNRADLLSMRGIAYEVAAITGSEVTFEKEREEDFVWFDKSLPNLKVQIEDDNICPVYCLAKISGLKVGPSTPEIVKKLNDSGVKSINNIVDITNLIMLEFGQPLHAFDANTVTNQEIVVRKAKAGEKLRTLDDKERELEPSDILITDSDKIIGLAGVMGGKNSEVTNTTTSILLEAAIFDSKSLRKTTTRLNLSSEASKRFIHGLTRKRLLQALSAALTHYIEIGGELTNLTIEGDAEDLSLKVPLTAEKVNSLIGIEITETDIEKYLEKLNFSLKNEIPGKWVVTPPYYRLDITLEEDLIEEVARMFGYENIPPKPLSDNLPERVNTQMFNLITSLKEELVKQGLTELQTYSYYSTKILNNLGFHEENEGQALLLRNKHILVRITNPMSAETKFMRMNIWPILVEKTAENLKNYEKLGIFEIGKVYTPQKGELPKENYRLAAIVVDGGDRPILSLYQMLKNTFDELNLEVVFEKQDGGESFFHPKRFFNMTYKGEFLGGLSEIHPRLAHKFGIEGKRLAVVEIDLEPLVKQ